MEPKAQLRALEQIEGEGLELLAIFHSHPKGPSMPSATDIAEAAYPVVNIIWSKAGRRWQARGFWIEAGLATEVPLTVLEV
jgi:proteasome lid subunit RPN8/RPN11